MTPPPSPTDILTQTFGYAEFRPGQEKLIAAMLTGRDAIGVMPTGGGKSLTYQIPARLLPGTVVVVSPLIALMKDQVDALVRRGFRATVLNSTLDWDTRRERVRELLDGQYELVYVAPEALEGSLRGILARMRVSLVAVDEAHCISEWGHDFRPAYRKLQGLKAELGGVPVLALTATATRRAARDIIHQLGMVKPDGFKGQFFRSNLRLTAHKKGDGRGSRKDILAFIRERRGQSGIVYALSRKNVESLAEFLRDAGVRAVPYHAGLDDKVRSRHQEAFLCGDADVVVATIAFGMGIDKPDVRFVIHRELPRSIESYYQEIGRAGRDGEPSECVLCYSWVDVLAHQRLQESIADPAVRGVARMKSTEMFEWAERLECRWRSLVGYFDEVRDDCGVACDRCRGVTFIEMLKVAVAKAPPARRAAGTTAVATIAEAALPLDDDLFERLRVLRRSIADAENVPAYIVFSDAVLRGMATERPTDDAGLLAIRGIGEAKLAKYGAAFLRVLCADQPSGMP